MEQHHPESISSRSLSVFAFRIILWIALETVLVDVSRTIVMGGVEPIIELIGLGAGLGVLGLIGVLGAGPRRRQAPVPVRTDEDARPRDRERR